MRIVFLLCVATLLVMACHRSAPPQPLTATQRAEIQSRVTNHFPRVTMLKPAESGFDHDLAVQLAPLLLHIGANGGTNGRAASNVAPVVIATVYVATNQTIINGKSYAQFTYLWNYPRREFDAETAPPPQGIRITVDSRGAPSIWEVLRDSTGGDVLYVGRSVEVLAQAEFGAPLPEHKFSVERTTAESGDTVVANVIDDGPVPMGPILYLDPVASDAQALICRCMPAQFSQLQHQQDYRLEAVAGALHGFKPVPLDQRLRLPAQF